MAITKANVAIKISADAQAFITARGIADAVQTALHLLPEYFSGATEVEVDTYAEPEEKAEPHLAFDLEAPLGRATFRQAVTEYFSQLRRENNPIHLYLAVVKR